MPPAPQRQHAASERVIPNTSSSVRSTRSESMTKKYMAILAAGTMLATAAIAQTFHRQRRRAMRRPRRPPPVRHRRPPNRRSSIVRRPISFLASSFKGVDVMGPDDKKIGGVNDLLFDKTGNIQAVVVGVGGFLGIGSKDGLDHGFV